MFYPPTLINIPLSWPRTWQLWGPPFSAHPQVCPIPWELPTPCISREWYMHFLSHILTQPPLWSRGPNTSSTVCCHPQKDRSREVAQAGPGSGLRAVWNGSSRTPGTQGMSWKGGSTFPPCERGVTGGGQGGPGQGLLVPGPKGGIEVSTYCPGIPWEVLHPIWPSLALGQRPSAVTAVSSLLPERVDSSELWPLCGLFTLLLAFGNLLLLSRNSGQGKSCLGLCWPHELILCSCGAGNLVTFSGKWPRTPCRCLFFLLGGLHAGSSQSVLNVSQSVCIHD